MNRKVFTFFAAFVLLFSLLFTGSFYYFSGLRLLDASDRILRRTFLDQSEIFSSFIREDLLLNNYRMAMKKLDALVEKGSITGYKIHPLTDTSVSEIIGIKPDDVSIKQEIYFDSDGGNTWGHVIYFYSVATVHEERRKQESYLIALLLLQAVLIVSVFGFGFSIINRGVVHMNRLIEYYVIHLSVPSQKHLIEFIWNPIITALRESAVKYKDLREKTLVLEKEAAVGRIIAFLTHDMRAPIGTFERLILTRDEDLPKMKPAIIESVNRLYSMVESLRHGAVEDLIKKTWTKLDFSFGYESLLGMANTRSVKLVFTNHVNEEIYADYAKVERAWINLVSNAIGFARENVKLESERKKQDLIIRVIDDGPGVPDEFLPRIFQRGATYGKPDGTGLGLAYVKQVMMGHGGDVRYYRENSLTVFECFIPNAFESKPITPIEKAHFELEIKEPLRRNIGIAFKSPSLCSEILDRLNKVKAETMLWHEGFDQGYDFIITDDTGIVDKCIDEGISVAQFKPDTPANEIVRRTLIRLGIPQIDRTEDV
jgi:signal transduction histidine kinase